MSRHTWLPKAGDLIRHDTRGYGEVIAGKGQLDGFPHLPWMIRIEFGSMYKEQIWISGWVDSVTLLSSSGHARCCVCGVEWPSEDVEGGEVCRVCLPIGLTDGEDLATQRQLSLAVREIQKLIMYRTKTSVVVDVQE